MSIEDTSCITTQPKNNIKKALFVGHLGLGDHICMIGAVRYFRTIYDEITIIVREIYLNNLKLIYKDDPYILFYKIPEPGNYNYVMNYITHATTEGYIILSCGQYLPIGKKDYTNIPYCFYNDLKLPYQYFWDYFKINNYNESIELYNNIKKNNIKEYIIIHNIESPQSPQTVIDSLGINPDEVLVIDIIHNYYKPTHIFYPIAALFINIPIIYYKTTLENADYIFIGDSCLFCLATHLELKTKHCYVIGRGRDYQYFYTPPYSYLGHLKKPHFFPPSHINRIKNS